MSPPIQCVILWDPGLTPAVNLTPMERYSFCMNRGCESAFKFIAKCIEASPYLRDKCAHTWKVAIVVFEDQTGLRLVAKRGVQPMALA